MSKADAEAETIKLTTDAGKEPALMLTRDELALLALKEALSRQGVQDVDAYLDRSDVEYRVWIHPKMGASVVILGAREKAQKQTGEQ